MSRRIEQLEYIINGAETRRFHTWPVLREQNVGLHSFGVAWLCFMLQNGNVRPHLLLAALAHDLPEHHFGDMPAPTKHALAERLSTPEFRQHYNAMEADDASMAGLNFEPYLTEGEARLLKLADAMEGALYCIRERRMGNQTIETPFRNFRKYIDETIVYDAIGAEGEIVDYIDEMWEQADA